MHRRSRTVVLLSFALIVAISGLPGGSALAGHNADIHTDNISYEGTSVQSSFTNSDIAFWGSTAYAGNYGGFRVFDISNPTAIEDPNNMIESVSCPGSQFDVSVWDMDDGDPQADILIASVDTAMASPACGAPSASGGASNVDSWEGLRIFDINNLENISQIAAVPTDCGSHTHTIAGEQTIEGVDYLIVYVASYPLGASAVTTSIPARDNVTVDSTQIDFPAGVRNNGTECLEPEPGEAKQNGVHDKISVVRIPLDAPEEADDRTPFNPTTDSNPDPIGWNYTNVREQTLPLAGEVTHINIGGRYFDITACHDINTFLGIDRAAGACWKEGIIWDISSPWSPLYLRRVRNQFVDTLFHSATFSWDGKIIVFEDEAGGGGENRCKLENGEPDKQGAMYFYKLNGDLQGIFKIPRDPGLPPCTAHNYNTVPTTDGRRITVSAWYRGGTSVIDYTDPTNPTEIGHYRNMSMPNDPTTPATPETLSSNQWSTYWYNGHIYVNDIGRGFEVYSMSSPKLENAIDLPHLNPQVQEDVIPQSIPTCGGEQATMWGTSADDDDLIGTGGRDVIAGLAGNDTISALGGNDLVCGGDGADSASGGGGHDALFGQAGADALRGGSGRDFCHGGRDSDEGRGCEETQSIP
jgi:RTX calcium-binding nonapeptide repeat (4 copies)/LVIVD repeat